MTAGTLTIEYAGIAGVARVTLAKGDKRWFGPGMRWRVADMSAGSRFELEVHADSKGQAEAPQPLRSRLLDEAGRVTLSDTSAFEEFARALPVGERRIVEGRFEITAFPAALGNVRTLFWHPLEQAAGHFVALIARGNEPLDLAAYLGRDHAVIEAALGGALGGDAESSRWLHATLERHLHIEEELIFPAYIEAGGREAWVRGLQNEHHYLRQYLGELDRADGRRTFLRLLDGHDEKEERVVYPDILARLGPRVDALLAKVVIFPIPECGISKAPVSGATA